jgi:hypothetical protein
MHHIWLQHTSMPRVSAGQACLGTIDYTCVYLRASFSDEWDMRRISIKTHTDEEQEFKGCGNMAEMCNNQDHAHWHDTRNLRAACTSTWRELSCLLWTGRSCPSQTPTWWLSVYPNVCRHSRRPPAHTRHLTRRVRTPCAHAPQSHLFIHVALTHPYLC